MKQAKIILVILLWGVAAIITIVMEKSQNIAATQQALPKIDGIIKTVYNSYKDNTDGNVADCNSYLKEIDKQKFGIAIVATDGKIYETGDTKVEFGIESIEKVITLCLAMQQTGEHSVVEKIGLTGITSSKNGGSGIEGAVSINPLVKEGALITLSLITKEFNQDDKWKKIDQYFDRFAGRNLNVIDHLYQSSRILNTTTKTTALSLFSDCRLYDNPDVICDIDAKLHSYGVTAKDLAVMAATLASGGINPVTKERLVESKYIPHILSLMSFAGLNEKTGEWMYRVGLPGMSGLGGGMICIVPGKYGIAVFAPPLDNMGNSVKAQMAIAMIAEELDANIYKRN